MSTLTIMIAIIISLPRQLLLISLSKTLQVKRTARRKLHGLPVNQSKFMSSTVSCPAKNGWNSLNRSLNREVRSFSTAQEALFKQLKEVDNLCAINVPVYQAT